MGDVGNAFIQAKPQEQCQVLIQEDYMFSPSAVRRIAIIVQALYGMKSSGAAWRETLATVLEKEMGFNNCVADPDLWMRPGTKNNGERYYTYMCLC